MNCKKLLREFQYVFQKLINDDVELSSLQANKLAAPRILAKVVDGNRMDGHRGRWTDGHMDGQIDERMDE